MSVKKKTKTKRAAHRPTKYHHSYNAKAEALARSGMTDIQMADYFNVDERTLNNWKQRHVQFFLSIKKGKDYADSEIENSLYHRAKGMDLADSHVAVIDDKVTITPIRKHIAPDTTACIFWLKNRQPEKWRDVKHLDHEGAVPVKQTEYDKEMSHEAIMRYAAKHQQTKEKPHDSGSK